MQCEVIMANFIELEVVKAIENDSGELEGIKWECIYVNIDSISYYKLANEVLRPYNKRELQFHDYKNTDESGAINEYLSKSKQQNAFLKGHFEDFMKKHGLHAPSIFDDDAHLSVDAVEIYFKPGTNPLGANESVLVSSCGRQVLTKLTLK
jgi:hypothetical protein